MKSSSSTASPKQAHHTFAIGASALALGYDAFLSEFKGLRFDFDGSWSTAAWIDRHGEAATVLGDGALWRAAPANPSACVLLPVNWRAAKKVVDEADTKPELPDATALAALDGAALACWYSESTLYSPVFIARLAHGLPHRDDALEALANWAIASGGAKDNAIRGKEKTKNDVMIWRSTGGGAAIGARGAYVAFSPDGALVDKALDTIARTHPSVADQMPTSNALLALMMPRPLSAMAEREILGALSGSGDANLLAVAQTHLPARMRALAIYPPYRLELTNPSMPKKDWQRVEWFASGKTK